MAPVTRFCWGRGIAPPQKSFGLSGLAEPLSPRLARRNGPAGPATGGRSGGHVRVLMQFMNVYFRRSLAGRQPAPSHLAEFKIDRKAIKASHLCSQLIIDTTNHRYRRLVTRMWTGLCPWWNADLSCFLKNMKVSLNALCHPSSKT